MNQFNYRWIAVFVTLFIVTSISFSNGDELTLEKIGEDIYCIHQSEINTGFFKFKDSIYVIDTHFPPSISESQKKLIRSVYKNEKFGFLIDTNNDIESVAGNQVFSDEAWILSNVTARDELSTKGNAILTEAMKKIGDKELKKIKIIPATITFEKELKLYDKDTSLEIIDAQNVYSTGNLIVNLTGKNVLFAGNLFFNKIVPDLKTAKLRDYAKELEGITKLNPSKIVPRHGAVGTNDDFLAYKEYIDTLISETQNFVKKGSTIEETLDGVHIEKFKDWKYYAERHPINVQKAYEELKSENNQILEFLKAIQQQKKDK
jgi:hypothetical protein